MFLNSVIGRINFCINLVIQLAFVKYNKLLELFYPRLQTKDKKLYISLKDKTLEVPSIRFNKIAWEVYAVRCSEEEEHKDFDESHKLHVINNKLLIIYPTPSEHHFVIVKDTITDKIYKKKVKGIIDFYDIFREVDFD